MFNHKWTFVCGGPFAHGITLRQYDTFDHLIPDLIYLASDLFVEILDHLFLIHLTMTDISKSLINNQIQLIKSSLDLVLFVQTHILQNPERRYLDFDG